MLTHILYGLMLIASLLQFNAVAEDAALLTMPPEQLKVLRIAADVWAADTNADGTGAYYDLMRLVFEPLGYTVSHQVFPMKRGIAAINLGEQVDILLADWSKAHLEKGGLYQIDRISTPRHAMSIEYVLAIFPPRSTLAWADIRQQTSSRVGWVKGYNYHKHLGLEQHNITRISNSGQGIKMLYKNHLDCFFDDRTEIVQFLGKGEFESAELRQEVVMVRKLYPVFHNDKKGRQLMAEYDARMAELISSGEIYAFYQRYGKNYHDMQGEEVDPANLTPFGAKASVD